MSTPRSYFAPSSALPPKTPPISTDRPPSSAAARWTRLAEGGSTPLIKLIVWLARQLPRKLVWLLLWPIAIYFLLCRPTARHASRQFLTQVFKRPVKLHQVFFHLLTFARVTLDRVYWLTPGPIRIAVEVLGDEMNAEVARSHAGAIVVSGHIGSFEALRGLGHQNEQRRVRPLMFGHNARKTQSVLNAINPALAADVITVGTPQSMLQIRDALAQADLVGILADRAPFEDERTVKVLFMEREVALPTGAFRLAIALQVPLVFACAVLIGDRYRLILRPLPTPMVVPGSPPPSAAERAAALQACVQRFAQELEQVARAHPYNWFNFYDFWAPALH